MFVLLHLFRCELLTLLWSGKARMYGFCDVRINPTFSFHDAFKILWHFIIKFPLWKLSRHNYCNTIRISPVKRPLWNGCPVDLLNPSWSHPWWINRGQISRETTIVANKTVIKWVTSSLLYVFSFQNIYDYRRFLCLWRFFYNSTAKKLCAARYFVGVFKNWCIFIRELRALFSSLIIMSVCNVCM